MRLCGIAVGGGVVCEYRTEEGYVNINCRLTSSVEVLLNGVCVPLVVCTEREMRGFCACGESSATPSYFASGPLCVFIKTIKPVQRTFAGIFTKCYKLVGAFG